MILFRSLEVKSLGQDVQTAEKCPGLEFRKLACIPEYLTFNREWQLEKLEREKKEKQWEEELNTAMMSAEEKLR